MTTSSEQTVLNFGQFSKLDASGSVEALLDELDRRDRLPIAVTLRKHLYELLNARPGEKVADIGCGTGKVVAELMECGVEAIGIDISEQAIARARGRFPMADFRTAPSDALPFADGELNGYVALLVYQHLQHPSPSLAEAWRVLGHGGRVVLADVENDLWAIDASEQPIVRGIVRAFADTVANPWIGRGFRSLLLETGFVEVTVELLSLVCTSYADVAPALKAMTAAAVASGDITRQRADSWLAEQERRGTEGRLFAATPIFFATGRRP
jgi:ubiquinone/menaquinone biosynthesis C-methylase UbiE